MATAPRPGSAGTTGGDEAVKAAKQTVTILLRKPVPEGTEGALTTLERKTDGGGTETVTVPPYVEVVRTLNIGAVPFKERMVVRRATGMPFETFMVNDYGVSVGLDTIQVWWWLASRAEGGQTITLDRAIAEWPDAVTGDTFEIIHDDGEDDDPQP